MSFTGLPGELLLDIFELAGGGELRMSAAITFSHVNGACRQLALSTPSLWSVLSEHLGADCASVFASRSQSLGLDIRISNNGTYLDKFDAYCANVAAGLPDFLTTAFLHFDRWTRLSIEVEFMEPLPCIHRYIVDECRRRQLGPSKVDTVVLRVRHRGIITTSNEPACESFKYSSFAPRSLEMDGVPAWHGGLSSSSLEHLVLRNLAPPAFGGVFPKPVLGRTPSLAEMLVILRESPNLRELVLDGSGPGDSDDDSMANAADSTLGEPMIMSRLQGVSLVWASALMAVKLLSMISLPALRSLHLHLVQKDDLAWRTLTELRHPMPVEELRIRISNSPLDAVGPSASPFARFANLCVLELDETQIHDFILRDLIGLPRLRHLALRFEPFITVDALEECVLSRLGDDRVCAIDYLEVVDCPNLTSDDKSLFEELVSNLVWYAYGEEDAESANIPYGSESDDSEPDYSSDSDLDAEMSDGSLEDCLEIKVLDYERVGDRYQFAPVTTLCLY